MGSVKKRPFESRVKRERPGIHSATRRRCQTRGRVPDTTEERRLETRQRLSGPSVFSHGGPRSPGRRAPGLLLRR